MSLTKKIYGEDFGNIRKSVKGDKLRKQILATINEDWPIHVNGVIKNLSLDSKTSEKSVNSRITYHFKKLAHDGKINMKKIDRALVVWPTSIEKLRVVSEMLGEG